MTMYYRKGAAFAGLFVLWLGETGVSQIPMGSVAMAAESQEIFPYFDQFMGQHGRDARLTGTHPSISRQKEEISQLFDRYPIVNNSNKSQMFQDIDDLKARRGIVGEQAASIKRYINDLMVSAASTSSIQSGSPIQAVQSIQPPLPFSQNMTLSEEEKKYWNGQPTRLTQAQKDESAFKLLRLWREATKNQFGGKGFISKNAENLVTAAQLKDILDANTGVRIEENKTWGFCVTGYSDPTLSGGGNLLVPGLTLFMRGKVPSGFFTPEAIQFLRQNAGKPFEMVAGENVPHQKCPILWTQ